MSNSEWFHELHWKGAIKKKKALNGLTGLIQLVPFHFLVLSTICSRSRVPQSEGQWNVLCYPCKPSPKRGPTYVEDMERKWPVNPNEHFGHSD